MRLALLLLFSLSCSEGQGRGSMKHGDKTEFSDDRVLVETASVERGEVASFLSTTGVLESEAQADIVPEATGLVQRIVVEEGDPVKKGALLAVLANPSLEAGADRASVEFGRAQRNLENTKRLHAQGAVSDRELIEAKDTLRTAEASLSEAQRTRGFTEIRSPIAGTVAVRDLRVGEVAGARRAFQVVDLEALRVVTSLPEKEVHRIQVGQPVVLQDTYDDANTASAAVARVSPVVDPATGTVRVTVELGEDQDHRLRPGQFIRVNIEVDRHTDVLTVPRRALVYDDGEPILWEVVDAPPKEPEKEDDEDQEAPFYAKWFDKDDEGAEEVADPWEGVPRRGVEKRRVEVGFTDTERAEVMSGISEGAVVVTVGNANLRGDARVRLEGDPAPKKPEDEDPKGT